MAQKNVDAIWSLCHASPIFVMGSPLELVDKSSSKKGFQCYMMRYPTTFILITYSTASTTPSPPQFPHVEFTIATHIVACKDLESFLGFQECKNPMLIVACKDPKMVPRFKKKTTWVSTGRPKKIENQPNRRGHAPIKQLRRCKLILAVEVIPLNTY